MKHWFRLLEGKIEKATIDSAAFDLFYNGEAPLMICDHPVAIPTGVKTEFSPRLRAQIKEKSGLALSGIELHGGVIDADYRGEWMVIARCPPLLTHYDFSNKLDWSSSLIFTQPTEKRPYPAYYQVQPGQKIAQFVLVELPEVDFQAESKAEIVLTGQFRTGGLGSTGLKAG